MGRGRGVVNPSPRIGELEFSAVCLHASRHKASADVSCTPAFLQEIMRLALRPALQDTMCLALRPSGKYKASCAPTNQPNRSIIHEFNAIEKRIFVVKHMKKCDEDEKKGKRAE